MIPGGMIGPVGGLEQVMFSTAEPMEKPTRYSTIPALSGTTNTQVLPRKPRVWACEIEHDAPQEGYMLDELEEWGYRYRQPLVWYSAAALGTNMIDPEGSLMDVRRWEGITPGGARVLPDGHLPGLRSLYSGVTRPNGTWAHLSNIPVPHSRTVTASITLTAYEGMTALWWIDELGIDNKTVRVHKFQTSGVLDRLATTFTTSPETVALTYGVGYAVTVAHPQLTLTDHPTPYGTGRGCRYARVEVPRRDSLWVDTGHHVYAAADKTAFTVTEEIRALGY